MTFTASDVLLKAASRVEEEGMWCQEVMFEGVELTDLGINLTESRPIDYATAIATRHWRVPECAIGALASAAIGLGVDPKEYEKAWSRLYEQTGGWPSTFNDTPGRTAHEVAEAMRQAALQ